MRYRQIIAEEVFASLAIGYHRTRNINNTRAIGETGFKAGGGAHYGRGIYLTYDFDDQQDGRMYRTYGPFIIRCKVNLANYVIFDPDIATQVLGKRSSLAEQFASFGIDGEVPQKILAQQIDDGITAKLAKPLADWMFRRTATPGKPSTPPPRLPRPVGGLVFTGAQDGRVIVAYDVRSVQPFAWAKVINISKTREQVKWNRLEQMPVPKAETMTSVEVAVRFFRQHGFTQFERGTGKRGMLQEFHMAQQRGGAYLMVSLSGPYGVYVAGGRPKEVLSLDAYCVREPPFGKPFYYLKGYSTKVFDESVQVKDLGETLTQILALYDAQIQSGTKPRSIDDDVLD